MYEVYKHRQLAQPLLVIENGTIQCGHDFGRARVEIPGLPSQAKTDLRNQLEILKIEICDFKISKFTIFSKLFPGCFCVG